MAEAENAAEALAGIQQPAPDVVLLDIELPGLDGMNLALAHALPPVIFVTAYPQRAVEAFDAQAVLSPGYPGTGRPVYEHGRSITELDGWLPSLG